MQQDYCSMGRYCGRHGKLRQVRREEGKNDHPNYTMKKTKKKLRTYRVWTEQINQMVWDVRAENEEDAKQKAERKWRREVYPSVGYIQPA